MYLLTKSETLTTGVTVNLSGVTDPSPIINGKPDTFVEIPTLAPILTIDLGSAKIIDTLWLKGENLNEYTIAASDDNTTFTDLGADITVPSHGHSYTMFTNTSAYRYWRLTFSARNAADPQYRLYGVFLMRLLLDLNNKTDQPLHYRKTTPRDGVVAYETYNRNLVQYNTEDEEKSKLTFQWEHLDNGVADSLEAIWKGAPDTPELTIYPRPDREPNKIYRAKWGNEFSFRFTERDRVLGKSGQAIFEEI